MNKNFDVGGWTGYYWSCGYTPKEAIKQAEKHCGREITQEEIDDFFKLHFPPYVKPYTVEEIRNCG